MHPNTHSLTSGEHVSSVGVCEEGQEVIGMAPHVIGSLCAQRFQAHPLPSAGQLVVNGTVHAVAIRLDLADLELLLC